MVNKLNKQFYNTIISQVFSHCGNYLVVGDAYGTISVFHLSKILNPDGNVPKEAQLPKTSFVVKEDIQVNSLLSTQSHLLVGTVSEVYAYTWKSIKTSKQPSVTWSIEIPSSNDNLDKIDINCMIYNEETGVLYIGCGDNNVYVVNLETRRIIRTLDGHNSYIHCLSNFGNEIISGGEDGVVNIWDIRDNSLVNKLEPYTNEKIARNNLGKWIGAVSLSGDWLLCGGGPRLSLWHFRFLSNSIIFPIEDEGIHVADIRNDRIFAGGRCKLFYQMSLIGEIITEIPTSAVTTYSAVYQEEPYKALCIAGSSPKIDISTNFMYRDQQLTLC